MKSYNCSDSEHREQFELQPFEDQFKSILNKYKRKVEEDVLFNVLMKFYFADWTRACDYNNMTGEDVVNCVMDVCRQIEKDYNYKLESDIFEMPFIEEWGDNI